jgi:hypothetical protein
MGKQIMGNTSTCNSIHKINNIKMNINKGWNYHRPRTFLISFPHWGLETRRLYER